MYSYEDRLRAVQLYIKLGKRVGLNSRSSATRRRTRSSTGIGNTSSAFTCPLATCAGRSILRHRRNWPSNTSWSTAADLRRRSRRWAIRRGHCFCLGPRTVPAERCASRHDRHFRAQLSLLRLLSDAGLVDKAMRKHLREGHAAPDEQECLVAATRKRRRYGSYMGEISPAPDNLLNRDFSASAPNEKWLTDITEF